MKKWFFMLLVLVMIPVQVFAQYNISGEETWSADQTLNTDVVVKSGGVLTIANGVDVLVQYLDVDGNGIGDVSITVEEGGAIRIGENVRFTRTGANAPVSYNHWEGIIVNSSSEDNDLVGPFVIEYAHMGLTVSKPVTVSSVSIYYSYMGMDILANDGEVMVDNVYMLAIDSLGIRVANDNTTLSALSLNQIVGPAILQTAENVGIYATNVDECYGGIEISGQNTTLKYSTISNATGNSLIVNGGSLNAEWVTVQNGITGCLINPATDSVYFNYCKIINGSQSGLVNIGADVVVTNSLFGGNTWHGILNSGGSLAVTESSVINNLLNGMVLADGVNVNVESVTDTSNGDFGVVVTTAMFSADTELIPVGGGADPVIVFNESNIFNNNNGVDSLQLFSDAVTTADFTKNWWGITTGVNSLISNVNAGSVDYSNWNQIGAYNYAYAEFDVDPTITIKNLSNNYSLISNEPYTVEWETTGYLPTLNAITWTSNGADVPDNLSNYGNIGRYTFTPDGSWQNGNYPDISFKSDDFIKTITGLRTIGKLSFNIEVDSLYGNDTLNIKWIASDAIAKVKIDFDDGSGTFRNIVGAEALTGSMGEFKWSVPNIASSDDPALNVPKAVAKLRISEVTTGNYADTLNNIKVIPVPNHKEGESWSFTRTLNSMNLYIDDIDLVDSNEEEIVGSEADSGGVNEAVYIGAFYQDSTDNYRIKCAGWSRILNNDFTDDTLRINDNDEVLLTIYGDDEMTPEIDGVPEGSEVIVKLWRLNWASEDEDNDNNLGNDPNDRTIKMFVTNGMWSEKEIFFASGALETIHEAIYQRGGDAVPVGKTVLNYVTGTKVFENFNSGWVAISSYVVPENDTLGYDIYNRNNHILSLPSGGQGFVEQTPGDFIMLKDHYGRIYWNKDANGDYTGVVDSLENTFDYTKGYLLKMDAVPDTFMLVGEKVNPVKSTIHLYKGWNLIPYYLSDSLSVISAFSDIRENIVVKDGNTAYWPEHGINTIGYLYPGKAYWVYLFDNHTDFRYPNVSGSANKSSVAAKVKPEKYVVNRNTDHFESIRISNELLNSVAKNGDEIGVYNKHGVLSGSAVYTGNDILLTVWGKDYSADDNFGFEEDEEYMFKVFSKEEKSEYYLSDVSFSKSGEGYNAFAISEITSIVSVESVIPTEFYLSQNYPNPFNPSTVIQFGLPETSKVVVAIYNVLGERVTELYNGTLEAGVHKVQLNAQNMASGVYFYNVRYKDNSVTKKMVLIK